MAFANERQWDLRDCSSLCNACKQKEKRNGIFIHFLTFGWLPSLSGRKSGKMHKCEGPLVFPNKVTVHSATVNNSKNVASAKVNIFYSDNPQCLVQCHGALGPRDIWHTCSPWRAALPRREGLFLWPFRVFGSICSSWSPCSSGCAWGAGGCSRCPWSAASASKSGSSTWSRPVCRQIVIECIIGYLKLLEMSDWSLCLSDIMLYLPS